MKLKYYMRGIGVGIIFSLFIFRLLVVPGLTVYTDDDIKAEARKLGMVEANAEVPGLSGVISGEGKEAGKTGADSQAKDSQKAGEKADDKVNGKETGVEQGKSDANSHVTDSNEAGEEEKRLEQAIKNAEEKAVQEEKSIAVKEEESNTGETEADEIKPEESETGETKPEPGATFANRGEKVIIEIRSGMGSESFCSAAEKAGLVTSASELDKYLSENGYDHRLKTGKFSFTIGMTFGEIAKVISNP